MATKHKRQRSTPRPVPWFHFGSQVTLLHGTSSAYLEHIQREGLKPATASLSDRTRAVLAAYVSPAALTDTLVEQVMAQTATTALRQTQGHSGRNLFFAFHPSDTAEKYAAANYQDGGEFGFGVRIALQTVTGQTYEPRFKDAQPVVVAVKVPWDTITQTHYELAIQLAENSRRFSETPEAFLAALRKDTDTPTHLGFMGDFALPGAVAAGQITAIYTGVQAANGRWDFGLDQDAHDPARVAALHQLIGQTIARVERRSPFPVSFREIELAILRGKARPKRRSMEEIAAVLRGERTLTPAHKPPSRAEMKKSALRRLSFKGLMARSGGVSSTNLLVESIFTDAIKVTSASWVSRRLQGLLADPVQERGAILQNNRNVMEAIAPYLNAPPMQQPGFAAYVRAEKALGAASQRAAEARPARRRNYEALKPPADGMNTDAPAPPVAAPSRQLQVQQNRVPASRARTPGSGL